MMKKFSFVCKTTIYFGTDVLDSALRSEAKRIGENVMIVTTGRSLTKHGYVDRLKASIEKAVPVKKIVIYDQISQNPKLEEVKDAVRLGKQENIQLVVGFGGGSALDAAKAAAVGIAADDDLEEYLLNGKEPPACTLPIIAIPTTAGTGSELSKAAILSSPKHHIKGGIRGEYLLPQAAIIDASFTWTVPRKITMETGFDMLAHAIESYVAEKANPFSEMLSEKAIQTGTENLLLLHANIDDHEARERMCFVSMMMGMNLATVGTCFPHRLQYPVGAATDTSHAAGLAALYPAWIRHEYEYSKNKIVTILNWMGYPVACNGEQAATFMADFLHRLEISYTLSDLGITEDTLESLAGQVTGNLANDKLAVQPKLIDQIFRESR
jgi:alcohol dehydrogenase class IV